MDYQLIPADGYHSESAGGCRALACTRASHKVFRSVRRSIHGGGNFCGRDRVRAQPRCRQTRPCHARGGRHTHGEERETERNDETNDAGRRARKRNAEAKRRFPGVVDGTCIRWIAASFGNPRGRSPSCSSYVGIRCPPPTRCPAIPLHKLRNGR